MNSSFQGKLFSPEGRGKMKKDKIKTEAWRASLVVQWLRIRLPMQGTWFKPWSRKIPHAAEQAWAPQLLSLRSRAHEPQLLKPTKLEPVLCNRRSQHDEKPAHRNEEQLLLAATRESPCSNKGPIQPKINKIINLKTKQKKQRKPRSLEAPLPSSSSPIPRGSLSSTRYIPKWETSKEMLDSNFCFYFTNNSTKNVWRKEQFSMKPCKALAKPPYFSGPHFPHLKTREIPGCLRSLLI